MDRLIEKIVKMVKIILIRRNIFLMKITRCFIHVVIIMILVIVRNALRKQFAHFVKKDILLLVRINRNALI